MEIRKASTRDLKTIQTLARDTIDKSYRLFLGDEAVEKFIQSGQSDQAIATGLERCYVLTQNGIIKAFCIYSDTFIEILMVAFEQHRSGFGTKLLTHMENHLFNLGHSTLQLETFKGNQQAIDFYLKNGWDWVREEGAEDGRFTQIIFEKHA